MYAVSFLEQLERVTWRLRTPSSCRGHVMPGVDRSRFLGTASMLAHRCHQQARSVQSGQPALTVRLGLQSGWTVARPGVTQRRLGGAGMPSSTACPKEER